MPYTSRMAAFTVKQEHFEGPLHLLLELIERRELHINDLALARVTDDFLAYAKGFRDFPLAESAQFALIAATLLLIKSKSLLPSLALTTEETQSIEELEHRLALLKRFRALSRHVRERFLRAPLFLPLERKRDPVFAPPARLSATSIVRALREVLAALPKGETLSSVVVKRVISLEEMILNLTRRIKTALRLNFGEFAKEHRAERTAVIVGFLALLELVRQGIIAVTQDRAFGEIMMETEEVGTPRY